MPCSFLCCVRPPIEDIKELDYSHCSLSDIPSEVFAYERTLERLHCQSNRITDLPRQLFICHELKVLNISDNEIQEIPSAISSLNNLQLLDCSKNGISSLPESIKCLKQLYVLDMSVNPLEKLPEPITSLIFLQELFLNDVYLEFLPGNFGRLTCLRILELRDNYLMILPKSLARSVELIRLDIGQNDFGEFPEVVGKFCKLQEFWIDCNNLTTISSVIGNLTKLIHFEASNNMITEIPAEISYCRDLVELSLSTNQIDQLPDSIGSLVNLISLKLDNNKLFGLPDSIGDLINLEELMLYSNFLSELPSTIGRLRKLQILNVDENMLTLIPSEIGSCSSLTVLSARSNRLTCVPNEVGHLSSLKVLNLVRNCLENLPQTLLNCESLVALWLAENQSKPLVPMQSEIDPRTRQQVLTCILFPQVTNSPTDSSNDDKKSNSSHALVTRHISFVDMKTSSKGVPEKPGQLRRAPTPYPKELRALAKHARNIQKDSSDEALLSMHNAVHIKAAKIAPTLQQRFASNHTIGAIQNTSSEWFEAGGVEGQWKGPENENIQSPNAENPYDKPISLEKDQSYQNLDQTLYSESNDSAYGGFTENTNLKTEENLYVDNLASAFHNSSIEDRVDGIIKQSSHDLYSPLVHIEENMKNPSSVPSIETLSSGNRSSLASTTGPQGHIYPRGRDLYGRNSSEKIYGIVSPQQNMKVNEFNNIGLPCMETYAQAKSRMGARRSDDTYGSYTSYQQNFNPDMHGSAVKKYQPDNYSISDRSADGIYLNSCNRNNGKSCELNVSPQGSALYHHHSVSAMDKCYDTNSVMSDQGIYGQSRSPVLNTYNIYESVPNVKTANTHVNHMPGPPLNPPPYHIAATFSKQAQFFNPPL